MNEFFESFKFDILLINTIIDDGLLIFDHEKKHSR